MFGWLRDEADSMLRPNQCSYEPHCLHRNAARPEVTTLVMADQQTYGANQFGVHGSTGRAALRGGTWRHVGGVVNSGKTPETCSTRFSTPPKTPDVDRAAAYSDGPSRATALNALGRKRASAYAPRASTVTGTTASLSATARKIASATFFGG